MQRRAQRGGAAWLKGHRWFALLTKSPAAAAAIGGPVVAVGIAERAGSSDYLPRRRFSAWLGVARLFS
jgi:hypothetical protein